MKTAAIGVRIHSGWGALVAVSMPANAIELVERTRVTLADPAIPGGLQPYHFAQKLPFVEARKYLDTDTASSERLALEAVRSVVRRLDGRGYRTEGCGLLMASGRLLPPLREILASHALLHTAEGEFFRNAIRSACERLGIRLRGYRERDLMGHANSAFGNAAEGIHRDIADLGHACGPPWTSDQKTAALAACLVLAEAGQQRRESEPQAGRKQARAPEK
jgi:hypothetical protein